MHSRPGTCVTPPFVLLRKPSTEATPGGPVGVSSRCLVHWVINLSCLECQLGPLQVLHHDIYNLICNTIYFFWKINGGQQVSVDASGGEKVG